MPKGIPKNKTNKGWFKKGNKLTLQEREKIRIGHKGINTWTKGKKHSKETKEKMSKTAKRVGSGTRLLKRYGNKDRNGWGLLPDAKEIKRKMSVARRGNKNSQWRGGISLINKRIRGIIEYRQWQSDVFQRDNWTCQTCYERGCYLVAHHIKSFAKILKENNIRTIEEAINCGELWDINNGITLCLDCHKLTKNYKGKAIKYA